MKFRRIRHIPNRAAHGTLCAFLAARARCISQAARIRVQPRRGKEQSEPETGLARSLQWTIVASVLPQPDVVHAGAEDALLLKAGEGAGEIADTAQKQCLQRFLSLDPINRVSYLESHCYMLNTLLRDADFMSLSLGLEVRVPRIDHLLAKAVLALPEKCKINGTQKRLLVEALQESLPSEIVNRPKRGFTLPFEHWMREDLRSEIEPILTAKHCQIRSTVCVAEWPGSRAGLEPIPGGQALLDPPMVSLRGAALVRITQRDRLTGDAKPACAL